MAKNIDFMGAVFPDVPSVKLPQQGGGLVAFDDTTDATATADKILQGYTAYANGQKLTGTASGGITPSGTMSITSNGTYDVTQYASADVNVSGGGGATFKKITGLKTSNNVQFEISGLEAEPLAFFLMLSQAFNSTSSSGVKVVAIDTTVGNVLQSKNNTQVTSAAITFFGTTRVSSSYNNGTLTIDILNSSAIGTFLTNTAYTLTYVY